MYSSRLFVKFVAPVAAVAFALAGILQLRAQIWLTGTLCVMAAVVGFTLSMRQLEKNPFTPNELEGLKPFAVPVIVWVTVASLVLISVFYVADNFKSPETDRVAEVAWVGSILLSLAFIWRNSLNASETNALIQKIRTNRASIPMATSSPDHG